MGLGLIAAMIATGEDFYPRLTLGQQSLSEGIPIAAAILGVLIGEVFKSLKIFSGDEKANLHKTKEQQNLNASKPEWRKLFPYIGRSAVIGTCIGALPGVVNPCGNTRLFFSQTKIFSAERRKRSKIW